MLILALMVQLTFAQERAISGVVSDEMGPVSDISVKVKGTDRGSVTDFDGNYSIQAKTGDILIFSHISFNNEEKNVGTSNTIDILLNNSGNVLDEVIITGYGNLKKDILTSGVSLVTSAEISELVSSTSVDNLLQGKAAGVQVTAANGQPGATAFVRIRGISSLTAGALEPLYIVDGTPIEEADLNSISSLDIENMTILKDAATTALYGSRGSNGVVVITTKKGSKNKDATFTFSSRVGYSSRIDTDINIMNAEQKLDYEAGLAAITTVNDNGDTVPGVPSAQGTLGATATPEERAFRIANQMDWEDRILRNGLVQSNSFAVRGGEEKTAYYFSIGHDRNTGIIDGISGFERMSSRLNVNFDARDWLDMGTSVTFSRSISDEPRDRNNVQNPFRAYYEYDAYENEFVLDDDGNLELDDNGDPIYNFAENTFLVTEATKTANEFEVQNTTIANIFANFKFSENLNNKIEFAINHKNFRRESYQQPGNRLDILIGDPEFPGTKRDNGNQQVDYTIRNLMNYSAQFLDKHSLDASALFEYNLNEVNSYNFTSSGFASSTLTTQFNAGRVDSGISNRNRLNLVSFGAFFNYDYNERYLLSASVRNDGSSNFGQDNQYGTFFSVGTGWNIAKEEFFKINWVDDLKIRASYGTVGNRSIGRYAALGLVQFGVYPGGNATVLANRPNPDLKWEETSILDIGLETKFFNKSVTAVFGYFRKETNNLLFRVPIPDATGFPFVVNSNIGSLENKGFEFELQAHVLRKENVSWTIGGNLGFLENKILELPDNDGDGIGDDIEPDNTFNTIFREGEPINSFILLRYDGVDSATGQPLYLDADGNSVFFDDLPEGDNRVVLDKSPNADLEGGFFSNFKYKGFGLRTDFVYKFGNYINNLVRGNLTSDGQSLTSNQDISTFNYWKNPGDTNVLPSPIYGNHAQQRSDRFLEKGDFVRLRNVTLSYKFSKELLRNAPISSIRIYAQGQNLLTFSNFFGDPEVGISSGESLSQAETIAPGEVTLYSYPTTKSFSFGIDINF